LFEADFDVDEIGDDKLIDICFALFDKFGLMHAFKLTASTLFLLFTRLAKRTGELWRSSIETATSMARLIIQSGLEESLHKTEVFCLILASLCSNVDNDFFPSAFAPRSDVALDILYSRQAVLEAHHCFEAITLIKASDLILLWTFEEAALTEFIDLFINLLLARDWQRHFTFLHEFRNLSRSGTFSMEQEESRSMLLRALMKCAVIGRMARVDTISHRYVTPLVKGFAKRGPLEKVPGLIFSSNARNRDALDIDRSAPIIFSAVFRPLLHGFSQLIPLAGPIFLQFRTNEQKWWGMVDAPEPISEMPTPETPDDTDTPEETQTPGTPEEQLGPDTLMEKE
jgi:hypothetical protein